MMMMTRSWHRLLLIALAVTGPTAGADQFDLGVAKGGALKMALWLDRHESVCNHDKSHKWENQVDYLLRTAWGHGNDELVTTTARQMKMSVEQVRNYPIQEFDRIRNENGGCKSQKYRKLVDDVYLDYMDMTRMLVDKEWWRRR